ncbi:MAG: hypothetical protein ACQETW_10880 [Pseudomonadota bacterium]
MQKTIPSGTLDLLRDLVTANEYQLSNDSNVLPSVLDLVLEQLVWSNALEDLVPLLASFAPDAVGPIQKVGSWRIPCRVRKATVGAGDSITIGAYDGPGATVQPFQPGTPGNFWMVVVTKTMPPIQHSIMDLSSAPAEIYGAEPRWVLNDETGGGPSDIYDALAAAEDTVAVVHRLPVPTGDFTMGPFPDGATVYVGFPRNGVLDYPDWFLEDFEEAGEQIIVDRALKIGGQVGGVSLRIETGGSQSCLELPEFIAPFLDRRIRFNVRSSIQAALGVVTIANIQALQWAPGSGDGALQFNFVERGGKPSLALTIEFAPDADDEIHVIDGPDIDIKTLQVTLFLILDVREERLYWEVEPKAKVTLESDLVPDGRLQDIASSVEKQIESTVARELSAQRRDLVGSWLAALPVLRHDVDGNRTFTTTVQNEPPGPLVLKLLDPLNSSGTDEAHEPEYPTSFLPSSLRRALLSDPQRILDRFVRYQGVSVQPDSDAPGRNQLVVDYDYFPSHHMRSEDHPYTREAIPRETFALAPISIRPKDDPKWGFAWRGYSGRALLHLMEKMGRGGEYTWAEKYLPKLTLEYEVRVKHEALPSASRVWHEKHTYPLAGFTPDGWPRYHFSDAVLAPPGFTEHLHNLEMPSVHNEPTGDVIHGATVTIDGEATLEYWEEKHAPVGCAAVLLNILRGVAARQDVAEAQAEAQSGGISEEPAKPQVLEAEISERYKRVVQTLGHFSGPAPYGLAMSEDSGLAADTSTGNQFTVEGPHIQVDFLLERHSVNRSAYDWIQAAFRSFSLEIHEKQGTAHTPSLVDMLKDGQPFELVARLQGDRIATARYRLDRGTLAPGTIFFTGRQNLLEGEHWKRQLYFPKDNTGFAITASLEVRRQGQILAEVSTSWSRTQQGSNWSDRSEWGIPAGHSAVVRTLVSDDKRLKVNLELRNQLHDPAEVPLKHQPKKLSVSFDKVDVLDDKDPFASGELEYWVDVGRKQPGEEDFVDLDVRRRSRVMELSTGDSTDPELADIEAHFKPEDELQVLTGGRELDNPGWFDPHDPLAKANETRTVTFDDGQDGPMQINSLDYVMHAAIRTISKPGAPQLNVWTGTDWRTLWETNYPGPSVRLKVYGSWMDVLELRAFEGSGSARQERPVSVYSLPGPQPVNRYGPNLPLEVSLTPAGGAAPEDFVYYVTLSESIVSGESRSYQLVAKNAAGYTVSDGYVVVSVV